MDIRRNAQAAKLAAEDYMNMLISLKTEKQDKEVYKNVERFLPLITRCTNITELNAHVFNELIEKIVVHEEQADRMELKVSRWIFNTSPLATSI